FWFIRRGREYIERAFHAARAADPQAALFYNDYNLEFPGPKQDSVYGLVSDLKARGVPVDGIGFQGHFRFGSGTPSRQTLRATFDRFAALGRTGC
ncbi:MAG TPA: endo-1,4-beta-xylanase, partial [Longimicrobiaceae bacterium]|nr:endo-1,4-beta-xylanase [Longimicrobiaceae bacterium]